MGTVVVGYVNKPEGRAALARGIEESSELIGRFGRFTTDAQREEVLHLFEEGRKVYAKLEKEHG